MSLFYLECCIGMIIKTIINDETTALDIKTA